MILTAKEYLKNDDFLVALHFIVKSPEKNAILRAHLEDSKMPEQLKVYYGSVLDRASISLAVVEQVPAHKSKRLATYDTEQKLFRGSCIAMLNLIAHCYKPITKARANSKIWK